LIRHVVQDDDSVRLEFPGRRTGHVATMFGKHVAYLTSGPVAVVCQSLYKQSDPFRAVAFVNDFFEVSALSTADSAFYGSIDRVDTDLVGLCSRQRVLQCKVGCRITATTRPNGRLNRPDVLADDFSACRVV